MLQYVLTGIAGLVLGIVIMRVWQSHAVTVASDAAGSPPVKGDPAANLMQSRYFLIGAGVLIVAAIAAFALRGSGENEQSVAGGAVNAPAMAAPGAGKDVADVDTMIGRLADRLSKNPNDGEGFRMLGWSYMMTGQPAKALEPYQRAIALLPDRADVQAGYGEALTGTKGGKVTPEAKAAFDKAIGIDPAQPRARYFLALWQAQNGQEREALEKWIALANDGPADAPWQADVREQIRTTSAKLGTDVAARLVHPAPAVPVGAPPAIDSATVQAASKLPASDRQAMVDQMVEGLATKLRNNPKDAEGWSRLLRSRMVLHQSDQAGRDLRTAREALKGDAPGLEKINATAREMSVPGA